MSCCSKKPLTWAEYRGDNNFKKQSTSELERETKKNGNENHLLFIFSRFWNILTQKSCASEAALRSEKKGEKNELKQYTIKYKCSNETQAENKNSEWEIGTKRERENDYINLFCTVPFCWCVCVCSFKNANVVCRSARFACKLLFYALWLNLSHTFSLSRYPG